jgi:hypothetical protein
LILLNESRTVSSISQIRYKQYVRTKNKPSLEHFGCVFGQQPLLAPGTELSALIYPRHNTAGEAGLPRRLLHRLCVFDQAFNSARAPGGNLSSAANVSRRSCGDAECDARCTVWSHRINNQIISMDI